MVSSSGQLTRRLDHGSGFLDQCLVSRENWVPQVRDTTAAIICDTHTVDIGYYRRNVHVIEFGRPSIVPDAGLFPCEEELNVFTTVYLQSVFTYLSVT